MQFLGYRRCRGVLSKELQLPRASRALRPGKLGICEGESAQSSVWQHSETQCGVVDSMCHLLSPPIIGSFFVAPLNSRDLGRQVSVSQAGFIC